MPLPSLPTELWHMSIMEADRESLPSIMRVSHLFHSIASPLLYHCIEFRECILGREPHGILKATKSLMKFLYLMGRTDERSRYACHVHTFAIALMLSEESNPISEEQNIFVKTLYLALKNAFLTFVNLKELRLVSARREAVARPTLSELLEIVPFRLERLQLLGFQFSEALPLINGHPSLKMLDFDDLGQTEAFTLSQLPPQLSPPIQLQVAELHFNSALGWLPTQASLTALHLKNFIVLDVRSPAEYKTWASLARAIESVRWLKISPYIQNCSLQVLIPHLRSLECLQIFDLVRSTNYDTLLDIPSGNLKHIQISQFSPPTIFIPTKSNIICPWSLKKQREFASRAFNQFPGLETYDFALSASARGGFYRRWTRNSDPIVLSGSEVIAGSPFFT